MNHTIRYLDPYRLPLRYRIRAWLMRQHSEWSFALGSDPRHPLRARRELIDAKNAMRRSIERQIWFGPDA